MTLPCGCVVLGLGNPLRGDDGVGLAVAGALARLLGNDPVEGVRVATSERGGLDVLPLIEGARAAIVVDCLEGETEQPGRAHWLSEAEMDGSVRLRGAHDLDLPNVLKLGSALGMQMPETMEVLGIEACPGPDIDDRLSPPVAAAVDRIAALLHAHLINRG